MGEFLLTWKEKGWPHENILRLAQCAAQSGAVETPWRLWSHNLAHMGDTVWLIKQGPDSKGVFGVGEIVGSPYWGSNFNGDDQWMARVRFGAFVDPKQAMLIDEARVRVS